MKISFILASLFLLLIALPAVQGDNNPDARFSGGGYDGYDGRVEIRSSTDWEAFNALITARNKGGSYDGFDVEIVSGVALPPGGIIILFR